MDLTPPDENFSMDNKNNQILEERGVSGARNTKYVERPSDSAWINMRLLDCKCEAYRLSPKDKKYNCAN
jgi:hypothetical protein